MNATTTPLEFNLFDVRKGFQVEVKDRAHRADMSEIIAYMDWQRRKLNLPDLGKPDTSFAGGYREAHCVGATWGTYTRGIGDTRVYQDGAYSIVMPGFNMHHDEVTCEELDEAGDVVRSITTAIEPKKGGVFMTAAQVRKAVGPVAKPTRAKRDSAAARQAAPALADPVASPAPAVASAQIDALAATVAALVERIGGLEATVATQAAALAAADGAGAPIADSVALDSGDAVASAREAYIAALIAERDAERERADAAEARAADFERIAVAADARADAAELAFTTLERGTTRLMASRTRTAVRLRTARTAAAEARWSIDAMRGQLVPLRAELDRLRPLAAAVQAYVGQPAASAVRVAA